MKKRKLLFEFNDTTGVIVGKNIDEDFNAGEVDMPGEWDPFALSNTINWGIESFYVMSEGVLDSFPEPGVHYFKANGITYEIKTNNGKEGEFQFTIEYIKKVK